MHKQQPSQEASLIVQDNVTTTGAAAPTSHELGKAALKHAEQGFAVFPLQPGTKVPVGGFKWRDHATTDVDTIVGWCWAHPNANIGIACGEASGLTVLDFDCKSNEPGLETAEQLLTEGWRERCPHISTPSGGVHVYVQYQSEWGNRKLRKLGPDIQGDGSYVVSFLPRAPGFYSLGFYINGRKLDGSSLGVTVLKVSWRAGVRGGGGGVCAWGCGGMCARACVYLSRIPRRWKTASRLDPFCFA